MLLKILDGPINIYKFGTAQRFSLIYQPYTTDAKTQKLNRDILDTLTRLLSDENGSVAAGDSIALADIAKNYARLGPVPDELKKIVSGESGVKMHENARSRMEGAWLELQALPLVTAPADAQPLSYPWDKLLDTKVIAFARTNYRDGHHGAWSPSLRGDSGSTDCKAGRTEFAAMRPCG